MKYFVAIWFLLCLFCAYAAGEYDRPVKQEYKPPMTLEYIIEAQKCARDTHLKLITDPQFRGWVIEHGGYYGGRKPQEQWVRMYNMTIDMLEAQKVGK